MMGVVLLTLFSFLLICLILILLFCLVYWCCWCCKISKRTKPSTRRDVELGLANTKQEASVSEDGLTSTSTLYRRITEPLIKNGKLYGQDYFAIKERLDRTKSLFLDDKFPADKYSISYNGKMKGKNVDGIVDHWVRASELYQNPEMIKSGLAKDDVNQGELGDCWMLAAMADLSEKEGLFQWVVPPGQTFNTAGYNGLFLFRFWRYGQWVEVVVDDLIPVKNKKPVFVHSKIKGEMWPCLLEKAYSKLQGSYNHLNSGMPMSAMVDFTGGFPQRLFVNRNLMSFSSDTVFTKLQAVFKNCGEGSEALVCAGTGSGRLRNGLAGPHAYSVFGVLEEDPGSQRPRLIKLRNPWGSGEWTGSWGKDWIRRKRRETSVLRTGPGEFFMDLQDFMMNFQNLTFCYIHGPDWREKQRRTEVSPDFPKVEFTLRLTEESETMISVSQIGRRQLRDEMRTEATLLNIKFSVFTAHNNQKIAEQNFLALRTRTFQKCLLAGSYRIIAEAEKVDRMTGIFLRVATTNKLFELS